MILYLCATSRRDLEYNKTTVSFICMTLHYFILCYYRVVLAVEDSNKIVWVGCEGGRLHQYNSKMLLICSKMQKSYFDLTPGIKYTEFCYFHHREIPICIETLAVIELRFGLWHKVSFWSVKAETHDATNRGDKSPRLHCCCDKSLALSLSLRYVTQIQTSLNLCDRLQRQNSVAATMIFTCHKKRFVAATCRGDVSQRFVALYVSALRV